LVLTLLVSVVLTVMASIEVPIGRIVLDMARPAGIKAL